MQVINDRETYEAFVKRGYSPLCDATMDNALRREIQNEMFGKHNAQGNQKFYAYCLSHLPLYCRECGKPIHHPSAFNVSHILSKGSHPEMAFDPRNVFILCPEHHEQYEHITTRRKMRIYEASEKVINLLKQEYNGHK